MKLIFIFLISTFYVGVYTIKVVKMVEDLESVNKRTNATVTDFDLGQLPEITICIRVYFYHFPVKSVHALKWFPILSSSKGGDILFSVAAFDTGNKSGDLHQVIPERIFQSKDLKNFIFLNRKIVMIRYFLVILFWSLIFKLKAIDQVLMMTDHFFEQI